MLEWHSGNLTTKIPMASRMDVWIEFENNALSIEEFKIGQIALFHFDSTAGGKLKRKI